MKKNTVGDKVRQLRKRLGLTQEELALKCELTQAYINFLETGKRGYTKKNLEKIAKTLDVPIFELFTEETVIHPYAITNTYLNKHKVAEADNYSADERKSLYEEIIRQLDKLPTAIVMHYKMLLNAELIIRNKKQ